MVWGCFSKLVWLYKEAKKKQKGAEKKKEKKRGKRRKGGEFKYKDKKGRRRSAGKEKKSKTERVEGNEEG